MFVGRKKNSVLNSRWSPDEPKEKKLHVFFKLPMDMLVSIMVII